MIFPNKRLFTTSFVLCLLCFGTYGYHLTVLNFPSSLLKDFVATSFRNRFGYAPSVTLVAVLWGITVGVMSVGALIGAMVAPNLSDSFGRRKSLMLINPAVSVFSGILFLTAKRANSYELLIVGRFLVGVYTGVVTSLQPVYLSELSRKECRGFVCSFHNGASQLWSFLAMAFSLPVALGSIHYWPFLLSIGTIPAVILPIICYWFPESPQYLYLKKNDTEAAVAIIRRYHGDDVDVQQVLQSYDLQLAIAGDRASLSDFFRQPATRNAVILGICATLAQAFSGINLMLSYSFMMLSAVGLSASNSRLLSLAGGFLFFIGGLLCPYFVESLGRRRALLSGLYLMLVSTFLFFLFAAIQYYTHFVRWMAAVSALFTILILFFYSFGPGPVPWFITSELTLQRVRSTASAVVIFNNNIAMVLINSLLPILHIWIGPWSVIVLSTAPCLICTFYLQLYLPETKNRDIAEIVVELGKQRRRRRCLRNRKISSNLENTLLLNSNSDDSAAKVDAGNNAGYQTFFN